MPGARATSALAGTRFADVRWVAETGSTNADALALARDGAPEGVVLVTDHQTAGRGRAGRTWTAPPASSLLTSILLRPPAEVADLATMAVAVAAAEAVEAVTGVRARLKWPNDLVWPGDGRGDDRKLAGILAEADWPLGVTAASGWRQPRPDERLVVVVGLGLNCTWPDDVPEDLAGVAVALNHLTGQPVDPEDVLIELLGRLDALYGDLAGRRDRSGLLDRWRARSATIGRRVRIEQVHDDWIGTALDITDAGHLVVETLEGERRTFAVGDVVHLRPA